MSFKIKTFDEIITRMISWITTHTTKINDFNQGSALRALLESIAWTIKDILSDIFITFRTVLNNFIYDAFGFSAKEALYASVNLIFSANIAPSSNIPIPIGTVVETSDGIAFATTEQGVLLAGQVNSSSISALAVIAGSAGNVSAGTLVNIVSAIAGIDSVNNPTKAVNGADAESEDTKRERFQEYVKNLARSTPYGIVSGAKSIDGVAQAEIFDTDIKGLLELYIDDGSGAASQELLTSVQNKIEGNMTEANPGYRGAGTAINYYSVNKVLVDITQVIYVKQGFLNDALRSQVEANETQYINTLPISKDGSGNVVKEKIRSSVMTILEVYDIVISIPTDNVEIPNGSVAKVGTISTAFIEV